MMAEDYPKKSIRPEAILGAFGVSAVPMELIVKPGPETELDVIAETDEFGFIVFRSTEQHELRPDNALFDGSIQPDNN